MDLQYNTFWLLSVNTFDIENVVQKVILQSTTVFKIWLFFVIRETYHFCHFTDTIKISFNQL